MTGEALATPHLSHDRLPPGSPPAHTGKASRPIGPGLEGTPPATTRRRPRRAPGTRVAVRTTSRLLRGATPLRTPAGLCGAPPRLLRASQSSCGPWWVLAWGSVVAKDFPPAVTGRGEKGVGSLFPSHSGCGK